MWPRVYEILCHFFVHMRLSMHIHQNNWLLLLVQLPIARTPRLIIFKVSPHNLSHSLPLSYAIESIELIISYRRYKHNHNHHNSNKNNTIAAVLIREFSVWKQTFNVLNCFEAYYIDSVVNFLLMLPLQ